jgi:glutamate racemase
VQGGADVLGLSCTHYPFVRPRIEALLPPDIRVYDSGHPVALRVRSVLSDAQMLGDHAAPLNELYTTTDLNSFAAVVSCLPGVPRHRLATATPVRHTVAVD